MRDDTLREMCRPMPWNNTGGSNSGEPWGNPRPGGPWGNRPRVVVAVGVAPAATALTWMMLSARRRRRCAASFPAAVAVAALASGSAWACWR
ncbi:hypothetical protein ACFQU7_10030 [Pseudoroseomonas wenyumeiae]